jgi:competence protein ComEA
MIRLFLALVVLCLSTAAGAALNLNTATKDELVSLPGIGPAKAQAIVDYRNQNGPFRSIDEIRKVKGIGEKLFNQIKPELNVGSARPPQPAIAKVEAKGDPKAAQRPPAAATGKDQTPKK